MLCCLFPCLLVHRPRNIRTSNIIPLIPAGLVELEVGTELHRGKAWGCGWIDRAGTVPGGTYLTGGRGVDSTQTLRERVRTVFGCGASAFRPRWLRNLWVLATQSVVRGAAARAPCGNFVAMQGLGTSSQFRESGSEL